MKICPNCQAQLSDTTNFCDKCGARVDGAVPPQSQPYPQPYPQPVPQQYAAAEPFDHTKEFDQKDISDNKVIAMCPYIFSIIGVIIALLASKESKFVAFHVRQALKIQVCQVLVFVCGIVPFLGWIVIGVWQIISIVLIIICFVRVCCGKAIEVPIIRGLGFMK